MADKWNPISIYLEIPEGQLNAIDEKHRGDPQKCLMAMLTESWLPRVSPPQTWQEIITEALEFVGYPDMAQKLRDKFCECHVYNSIKCKYKNWSFLFGHKLSNLLAWLYQACLIVLHRLTVYNSIHSHLKLQLFEQFQIATDFSTIELCICL